MDIYVIVYNPEVLWKSTTGSQTFTQMTDAD